MSDRDPLEETFASLHDDLTKINAKLERLPTTRECWAFVIGFGTCAAVVVITGLLAVVAA